MKGKFKIHEKLKQIQNLSAQKSQQFRKILKGKGNFEKK